MPYYSIWPIKLIGDVIFQLHVVITETYTDHVNK